MPDLTTKYAGLLLKNPIIAGSCGLTNNLEDIKKIESNGAAAVVLKSIFEEEIQLEINQRIKEYEKDNLIYSQLSETLDYIDLHLKENRISQYLTLIRDIKKQILIPVIASINCITSSEWTNFSKKIEEAGADALELNLFRNPADLSFRIQDSEKTLFEIVEKVLKTVSIPVTIKISQYYSNLGQIIKKLSETKIAGIVLFNRFYNPDIDIENLKIIPSSKISEPNDYLSSLRWIAIMYNKTNCDLSASTGIHDGSSAIKQILAGASSVQIVSALYKNGIEYLQNIIQTIEKWMERKGYNYIGQFKGKLSQDKSINPAAYERMQFMKYFSDIK